MLELAIGYMIIWSQFIEINPNNHFNLLYIRGAWNKFNDTWLEYEKSNLSDKLMF